MNAASESLMHEALSSTLTRTGDWLKFAETKNAALLTFASAWLLALGNLLLGANPPTAKVAFALQGAAVFVFGSATICLYAILPRVKFPSKSAKRGHGSLLFYGHLSAKSGVLIYQEMKERFLSGDFESHSEAYLQALASEISGLSAVATRKYKLFNVALIVLSLAPVVLVLLLWKCVDG